MVFALGYLPPCFLFHQACFGNLCFVLDNSIFKEVHSTVSGGFRLYNQFCVFIYAQLQVIFPASFLGNVANWDSYLNLDMEDDSLPYKTVDKFLQDRDFSDLITRNKISTPRKFVNQAISFYRHFIKTLLGSELASSSFTRVLSSFDEAVIKDGAEVHYSDSIQFLCSYFIQQKWIAPHLKPVIVSEYCSLVTKFRMDKVSFSKEWVASFSCYYELQSRVELFRLFRVCCEALSGPCKAPPPFNVSMPGLKSDRREFTSTVRSLQCTISSIQKVESLFLTESALPHFFELLNQGPGLLNKRKFSVWHLLSSSYFQKIGISSSLESFYEKSVAGEETIWLSTTDKADPSPSRSSSAKSTPRKVSSEKQAPAVEKSPALRSLTEIPLFPARAIPIVGSKGKKKNAPPTGSRV